MRYLRRTSRRCTCRLVASYLAAMGFVLLVDGASSASADRTVRGFDIYVHHGRDSAYDYIWDQLGDRIDRIRADLGDHVLRTGEIHIVSDLNRWFRDRGEPERAPRWAQALTMSQGRIILLKMPDDDPIQTLTHELSHLGVYDAVGQHHVPRWFLEGYAMIQAEQWGLSWTMTIAKAALFGNTISFENLDTSFPPHYLSADLAYAQSFHMVRRLLSEYGSDTLQRWLEQVALGADWKAAFWDAFGVRVETEYRSWEDSIRVWYAWIPAIASVTTMWTALALLAFWVGRRVRKRRRLRLEAMELAESQLYGPDPDDDLFR